MNKIKKLIAIVCSSLVLAGTFCPTSSHAANNIMNGNEGTIKCGSGYWTTSNIREWLNSDTSTVSYTNIPPNYKAEAGFLNGFTTDEKNAIAVTEKRSYLSALYTSAKNGGSGGLGHLNFYAPIFSGNDTTRSVMDYNNNIAYKNDVDKVFLLNPTELYSYVVKRGGNLTKSLTSQAKSKNNISNNTYNWWLGGSTVHGIFDYIYSTKGSNVTQMNNANAKSGVVPAINLKKDYRLSDGKYAKDLNIGDEVSFGKYLNSPIIWEVINISDDGYPMLLSKNVLDIKEFDKEGDTVKTNSEYVNFPSIDVSYKNGLQYKSTDMSTDIESPVIEILNKEELTKRQNGAYVLNFRVTDNSSGIKYIQKPDGTKITSNEFSITFSKNSNYILKTMDNAGNYSDIVIPIANINDKPFISISQSTSNWTNQNVFVDIQSSNEVTSYISDFKLGKGYSTETSRDIFPNYTSYANKTFRITGKMKLLEYNQSALNQNIGIGFNYYVTNYSNNDIYINGSWSQVYRVPMTTLINSSNQEVEFSFDYTVPSNYAYGLRPYIWSGVSSLNPNAIIEFKNLKYQLVDDSDFAISGIQLPNGTVINDKIYRDEISTEGINEFSYSVLDNNHNTTSKIITTKIDKTKPIAKITKSNSSWTNENITLTINAADELSGVKRIKLPNGNWISSASANYVVSSNGSYTFVVEDVAGNQLSVVENVTNIDKSFSNTPVITTNSDWTNAQSVSVSMSVANDSISGTKQLLYKLSGATTSGWLEYNRPISITREGITTIECKAKDNAENTSSIIKKLVNIDRTTPDNNDIIISKK